MCFVSVRYCKSRSGCSTCCNGYAHMFEVYIPNISFLLDVCWKCFHLDITKVDLDVAKIDLDVAYKCMLQAYISSVSGVSYVCCECFRCMYQVFHLSSFVCCNCCI